MSPCFIRLLTPQGLVPVEYTAESLAEAARFEPANGVYTVANTLNTFQTLKLDAHLDRMEDSAARAGLYLKLDRRRLKLALRQMIAEARMGSVRFRVTVGRDDPDAFIISLEPYKPPSPDLIANGARVVTVANSARQNAAAKTTNWMHQRESISASLAEGIYDAILLDIEGCLLEGLGSNFYAVLDGVLRTAGEGVLRGIAQQVVFEIASPIIPIQLEAVRLDDVPCLSEAFITSSSRGIIPVVEIDGQRLGDGNPGPVTLALRQAYESWVENHLETLPIATL